MCILICSIRNGGFFNFHFFGEGRFQFFNIRRIRANCIMADLEHFLRTFNGIVPLFWETDSFRPPIVCFVWASKKERERNASYRTFPTQFDRAASQSKSESHKNKIAWGSPHCCWPNRLRPSLQSQENLLCLLDVWRISVWRNSKKLWSLFCKHHYCSHGTLFHIRERTQIIT